MADWASLQEELLGLILKCLPYADYARFSAVCKAWRSVAAQKPYPPAPQLPWLWTGAPAGSENPGSSEFYSPSEDRTYKQLDLPAEVLVGWPCGSYQDWLSMATDDRRGHFLYNPFSKSRLQLPQLDFRVKPKIVLSLAPDDPNCIAVAICPLMGVERFAVCRPMEKDGKWTYIDGDFCDAIFYRDSLYVATCIGELKLVEFSSEPPMIHGVIPPLWEPDGEEIMNSMVEFQGDMFMVNISYSTRPLKYRVFRANLGHRKWELVKSLGDLMIFVDSANCLFVRASDLPDFEPNCIYGYEGRYGYLKSEQRNIDAQADGKSATFSRSSSISISCNLVFLRSMLERKVKRLEMKILEYLELEIRKEESCCGNISGAMKQKKLKLYGHAEEKCYPHSD